MGCVGAPDPKPDTDTEQEPKHKPVDPSDRDRDEHKEPDSGKDKDSQPDNTEEEEEEDKEVNVVVTEADNESKVMTLIMVIVPLLLILCILVLIYGILRSLQKKETPRALVHCKRSLQNWVWGTDFEAIEPDLYHFSSTAVGVRVCTYVRVESSFDASLRKPQTSHRFGPHSLWELLLLMWNNANLVKSLPVDLQCFSCASPCAFSTSDK